MAWVLGDSCLVLSSPFPVGFEEGLTVATVVESALCALRNCLAFMPPGKDGLVQVNGGRNSLAGRPGTGPYSCLSYGSGTEPSSPGAARASGVGQQVG